MANFACWILAVLACCFAVWSVEAIEEEDVLEAQEMWGSGIVNIGSQDSWEESKEAAEDHINTLYAYDTTGVVFKPTKASDVPFRNTFDSALSYFVGQNDEYPEDGGFALEPWTDVRFDNKGIVLLDDAAIAGGVYYFTDTDGGETAVEYTFVYTEDEYGNLRISAHHSSLPFAG